MCAASRRTLGITFLLALLSAVNLTLGQGFVSSLPGRTGRNSFAAFVPESTITAIQNGADSTFKAVNHGAGDFQASGIHIVPFAEAQSTDREGSRVGSFVPNGPTRYLRAFNAIDPVGWCSTRPPFGQGLVLALAPGAEAQTYDALHGSVTDSTGAWIPDATVTTLNTSTGISAINQLDKDGYSIFPQLQVGLSDPFTVALAGRRNGT
jgi:hypothetical protein